MQIQIIRAKSGAEVQYRNVFHAGWVIAKQHGIRGVFQGLPATYMRDIPAFGCYFGKQLCDDVCYYFSLLFNLQHFFHFLLLAILVVLMWEQLNTYILGILYSMLNLYYYYIPEKSPYTLPLKQSCNKFLYCTLNFAYCILTRPRFSGNSKGACALC